MKPSLEEQKLIDLALQLVRDGLEAGARSIEQAARKQAPNLSEEDLARTMANVRLGNATDDRALRGLAAGLLRGAAARMEAGG
jgi:hypothetical protein